MYKVKLNKPTLKEGRDKIKIAIFTDNMCPTGGFVPGELLPDIIESARKAWEVYVNSPAPGYREQDSSFGIAVKAITHVTVASELVCDHGSVLRDDCVPESAKQLTECQREFVRGTDALLHLMRTMVNSLQTPLSSKITTTERTEWTHGPCCRIVVEPASIEDLVTHLHLLKRQEQRLLFVRHIVERGIEMLRWKDQVYDHPDARRFDELKAGVLRNAAAVLIDLARVAEFSAKGFRIGR
jgi:hypothetical protein